jgi:oligopeptide transport system ATP-binding protein
MTESPNPITPTDHAESGIAPAVVPLLSVRNLRVHFPIKRGLLGKSLVKAVDDVSFDVGPGETFGLVGESGCGKTTTGKSVLQIIRPTAGEVTFRGRDLLRDRIKSDRRDMQLIFQDPYGSLDPRQSVFSILREAVEGDGQRRPDSEVRRRIDELLDVVELGPTMRDRYPHEMSGGQRQRLGIARALACDPKLIVCDEPVSALDVSIQAQVINLFKSIQKHLGISYIFVAHDLAVVRHVSHRIGVMYLGKLVEVTEARELYSAPLHPYTQALLSAIPLTDYHLERARQRILLEGEVPSPINRPSGCPFHPRCSRRTEICTQAMPELRTAMSGHLVACHNV